jgi:hypothetical protein
MRRAAVLLAALPLLLAACGGGGSKSSSSGSASSPDAVVKQSATKTVQVSSEHVDMKATATVQGQAVTITGNGDFDNAKRVGSLTAHAAVNGLNLEIDEILAGSNLYLKSPFFAAMIPKGKTWLRLVLRKAAKAQGIDFDSLISQDPAHTFGQLQALQNVTKVGVEGTATHYRGTIDIAKLPQGERLQRTTGVKYGPYDVWVGNDDGYIHRLKTSYSYAARGQKQSATLTMNFSNFGKAVSITVPSAKDAATISGKSLGGLGG